MSYRPSVYNAAPLLHFNQREHSVEMLVIHSMAHEAVEGIARLDELGLSAHYVIDFDGAVWQCVSEEDRAWHAGVSLWQGLDDINSRSIGIEVCHNSLGQSKFGRRQIKALTGLCHEIIERWNIERHMVVGHSDIAPTRKPDPGKAFPWEELAAEGIGIWYGKQFSEETNVIKMLSDIGYDTKDVGAAAYAFCRHFLPTKVKTMPVRRLLDNPYPKNCDELLSSPDFIRALQNIYAQYIETIYQLKRSYFIRNF